MPARAPSDQIQTDVALFPDPNDRGFGRDSRHHATSEIAPPSSRTRANACSRLATPSRSAMTPAPLAPPDLFVMTKGQVHRSAQAGTLSSYEVLRQPRGSRRRRPCCPTSPGPIRTHLGWHQRTAGGSTPTRFQGQSGRHPDDPSKRPDSVPRLLTGPRKEETEAVRPRRVLGRALP